MSNLEADGLQTTEDDTRFQETEATDDVQPTNLQE